jgi:hypothetical protein
MKRVREREKRKYGSDRRHYILRVRGILYAFKVHRHCPLLLLIEVRLREDKSSGREGGKGLGSELC